VIPQTSSTQRGISEANVNVGGTNKLKYDLSLEDLVALSSFHLLSSGLFARRVQRARLWILGLGTIPLVVAGFFLIEYQSLIAGLAAACYLPLIAFDFLRFEKRYRRIYKRLYEKRIRAILSERYAKDGRGLGEHTVEIEGDWIVSRSQLSEERCLVAETELKECGEHSFVFLGANAFCILSRKQIVAGNFEVFLNELKSRTRTGVVRLPSKADMDSAHVNIR
jgi:hypothetical protein